jgi:hypothetical protein
VAKARKGSRKPAPRAKGRKSPGKRKKKPVLDLKKLLKDIVRAKALLAKRQQEAAPKAGEPPTAAAQQTGEQLTTTQSVLDRWAEDIAMLCADPNGEPCGPTMVIS